MTEIEEAIELANKVLDKPYIDPDGDICLLARQFLRAIELQDANSKPDATCPRCGWYLEKHEYGNCDICGGPRGPFSGLCATPFECATTARQVSTEGIKGTWHKIAADRLCAERVPLTPATARAIIVQCLWLRNGWAGYSGKGECFSCGCGENADGYCSNSECYRASTVKAGE